MVCDELQEEGDHEPHVRGTAVFVGDELSVVNKTSDLLHQLWGVSNFTTGKPLNFCDLVANRKHFCRDFHFKACPNHDNLQKLCCHPYLPQSHESLFLQNLSVATVCTAHDVIRSIMQLPRVNNKLVRTWQINLFVKSNAGFVFLRSCLLTLRGDVMMR